MTGKTIWAALAVPALSVFVGFLAACGGQQSTSGPPPTPHPATADEIEIVRYALITDVMTIETVHRVVTMTYTPADPAAEAQSVWFEADFKAPDALYARGNLDGTDVERMLVGMEMRRKDENGQWVAYTESNDAYMALLYGLNMPYEYLRATLSPPEGSGAEQPAVIDTGEEERFDGTLTRHFTWETSVEPAAGGKENYADEVWVDMTARRAYRLLDCRYGEGSRSIPDGLGCWSIVMSKFNEPAPALP